MKKLFLLSIGTALSFGVFAQGGSRHAHVTATTAVTSSATEIPISHERTTAIGGSDTLTNWTGTDTLAIYSTGTNADSGYCAGTDVYGDHGFAERYDFNTADSSLRVTGVIALFGGTVSPSSTNHVTFKVWSVGAQVAAPFSPTTGAASSFWFDSGFPNTVLTSQNVQLTNLGLDTLKIFMFATPTAYLNHSFFVGYDITYTWGSGDTIGLYSNKDGERTSNAYNVVGTDSIANNVNVTEFSDNTWHDNAADNFGLFYNYAMFPIVAVGTANLSVSGVTRNDLTFFGNYPNPAVNSTNIKFSLANSASVTVTIADMSGRTINEVSFASLTAGEHIVPVPTANLAAGDYIYVVHTSTGSGIASKLTVIK